MQPHLQIKKGKISKLVLMPGDPGRVEKVGELLESPKVVASNREFKTLNGYYKNKLITVCSTGIGCPSTAIAAEELIGAGAEILIRIGTCGGSWREDLKAGSLMIPTASVRDEGTTLEYIPQGFPAVADFEIVNALSKAAKTKKYEFQCGINRTHDAFYGSQQAITKWGEYLKDEKFNKLETPIWSSEMECSALFVIASMYGIKAGAILAVDGEPEPLKLRLQGKKQQVKTFESEKVRDTAVKKMLEVVLEASYTLI